MRHLVMLAPVALILATLAAFGSTTDIVSSPNDDAEYESIELENGLKVLLVSDPDTDKAAAALAVHVGAGADPRTRQGLAHFLEHMLLLGTHKYPRPGEYHEFIQSNGGSQNAYTSHEFTVYFFDIESGQLRPALDRFSQFFIAPLLSPEYVEREMNAVESEFRSRFDSDARRGIDVLKELLNPRHPYTKFQGGNLETLSADTGTAIRDEMLAFYQKYYSASLMTLVVYGAEPIVELKSWVTSRFDAVPNTGVAPISTSEPLLEPGRLPARVDVIPKKDIRRLELSFPIPPVREHYLSKPLLYIGDLLGHEGKGSLLSLLKQRGWADSLSAGAGLSQAEAALFNVSISLTQQGVAHVDEITALVFEHIRLIRSAGVREWTFDEQSQLSALSFRFKQRGDPGDYVTALATSLALYPAHHVLYGPYALESFEPGLINSVLERLVPENLLQTLTARGLDTNRESRWLRAPYSINAIAASTIDDWKADSAGGALALPTPNEFIPTDLELKASQDVSNNPVIVEQRPGLTAWHLHDVSFGTPRSSFFVSIQSPQATTTATNAMLTKMYLSMVNDLLNEFSYPATLAGLGYSLYPTAKGLSIRISGYHDKQTRLLTRIVTAVAEPMLAPARFEILKERMVRRLRNSKRDKPFRQTGAELGQLLLKPNWSTDERITALESLTVEQLRAFVPVFLERVYVLSLSHGNVEVSDAKQMTQLVTDTLVTGIAPNELLESQVVELAPAAGHVRALDVEHNDSAMTLYFQGTDRRFETRARYALLSQVLGSPFYTELRTEKQLGYVVYANYASFLEVPGISFVIQSPATDPLALERETNEFLMNYAQPLSQMDTATFSAHKAGLISTLLEEDKSLWERSTRYWYEIDRQQFDFLTTQHLVDAVRRLEKDEFEQFFHAALLDEERRYIVVRTLGSSQQHRKSEIASLETREPITDVSGFRSAQRFFQRRQSIPASVSD